MDETRYRSTLNVRDTGYEDSTPDEAERIMLERINIDARADAITIYAQMRSVATCIGDEAIFNDPRFKERTIEILAENLAKQRIKGLSSGMLEAADSMEKSVHKVLTGRSTPPYATPKRRFGEVES